MHITEELRIMRAARNGLATLLLLAAEILTIVIAAPPQTAGSFARLDPAFDALVPKNAQVEKLAGGFTFIEGPLWRPQGALWFSDVVGNVVRQWSSDGTVTEILRPGGYDGNSLPAGGFVGPNGMVADRRGAVLICQHGNRCIARMDKDKRVTTLVDKFEGKRFNSPNDLVFRSDGSLYFTDPPYGLSKGDEDPTKELPFNGVFRFANGKLQVLVKDLSRPNGIAFSPDYKTLYVANSDEKRKIWMRYDVTADGTVKNGRVFADVTAEKADGLPDGMKWPMTS
jgi:gluconolactonase